MPLQANSAGRVQGSFNVPAGVPIGTKLVTFRGSGGSFGEATYVASGTIETRVWRRIVTTVVRRYDPLAQTFTLPEARMIGGVELKFCAVGNAANPVFVQIRGTETGLPTQEVLGEGFVNVADFVTNGWTRINFTIPVLCEADREYAIVVITDDANHSCAVARLGSYYPAAQNGGQEGYVTAQPYQVGVLLSSSNASTWTPHQEIDLAFRLLACRFTQSERTVNFGNVTASNVTDIKFLGSVERTSAATDVEFQAVESVSANAHRGPEDQTFSLPQRVTDTFAFRAKLTGDEKMSPILFPGSQLVFGTMENAAGYISRAVPGMGLAFSGIVTFEILKPGSAAVQPKMETQRMNGQIEVVDGNGVYQSDYENMTLDARVPVGDGWFEETWRVQGLRGVGLERNTRVVLSLTGTPLYRPQMRNLRAIFA